MKNKKGKNRYIKPSLKSGSISIYIVLVVMLLVTSSAIILSSLLSRQIRISQDIIASERAFYAAGSGVEEMLHALVQLNQSGTGNILDIDDGLIEYEEGDATYKVSGALFLSASTASARPCVNSVGTYRTQDRRVNLQSPGDSC